MDRTHSSTQGEYGKAADAGAGRAAYRAPQLRVIGDAATLTQRNWFAPGRVDGGFVWRRTG